MAIGDCNDNALIEALSSRMQIELLDTHRWTTRVELANAIFGVQRDLPQRGRCALREARPRLGHRSRLGAQDRDAEPDPRPLEDEKPDVMQPD